MDLTIEGKAFVQGSFQHCCIGITEGKIVAIKKIAKGDRHIDAEKHLILPAGIDLHVHFRDPGFSLKEDFSSGSLSALYGGITCVFDMPNTNPPTISQDTLKEKTAIAQKKSYIDFGLYAGITNTNIDSLDTLAPYCDGFKIYLGATHSLALDRQHLQIALQQASILKKPVFIHAEDKHCLTKYQRRERTLADHLQARPSVCEEAAIAAILQCSISPTTPIHICHLSSCEGFEKLQKRPHNISVGVTPHHLYFDIESNTDNSAYLKVNPPLRTKFDRETLWHGVTSGHIDILESDHAPHRVEEKEQEFHVAPAGIPGVETIYPLLLHEVKEERLSFQQLLSLLCERPAKIMGLPKGAIKVGNDADLFVVNFNKPRRISNQDLHSKAHWTPYEGRKAFFPNHVFLRGEQILEDGICICSQHNGKKVFR